jgi:hypothetical protein
MKVYVDPWDPGYRGGSEFTDSSGGPGKQSSAQLNPDVELPAAVWRPLAPAPDIRTPATVLMVDGVRRRDAGLWLTDDDGVTHKGGAFSYAAGVVRCDLRQGAAAVVATQIRRSVFTPSPRATDLTHGAVSYQISRVATEEKIDDGVQGQLAALEVLVSHEAREHGDDLLVVDGQLKGRAHFESALGYIKTHETKYLSPELSTVVTALAPGQRTPVFLLGTSWHRYTWYLRLPGPPGAPWSGVVRVECSAELTGSAATALADLSAVTLPRFASTSYKDPRAPQNLVPIAGLERRLRGLLGDSRLLHRSLLAAARRTVTA